MPMKTSVEVEVPGEFDDAEEDNEIVSKASQIQITMNKSLDPEQEYYDDDDYDEDEDDDMGWWSDGQDAPVNKPGNHQMNKAKNTPASFQPAEKVLN